MSLFALLRKEAYRTARVIENGRDRDFHPVWATALMVVQDRFATGAKLPDRFTETPRRLAIGFLTLQKFTQLFTAKFLQRISAEVGKNRIHPLHQTLCSGTDQGLWLFLGSLIRELDDAILEPRRRKQRLIRNTKRPSSFRERCGKIPQSLIAFKKEFEGLVSFFRQ